MTHSQEPHREGWLPAEPKLTWKVWGDTTKPFFEGTEAEVIDWWKRNSDVDLARQGVYIEDPDGNEYVYSRINSKWEDA